MNDTEYQQKIADLGIEQFVRNVIVGTLKEYVGKPEKADEVITEINKRLMEQFREKAKIVSDKVFEQLKNLI